MTSVDAVMKLKAVVVRIFDVKSDQTESSHFQIALGRKITTPPKTYCTTKILSLFLK